MQDKEAGGEIIGGLAGLAARPFVGAIRSGAIRSKIVQGITSRINDPLERLLHRIGVSKAIEGGAHAAAYLGGAPEAIRTPWAREQAAKTLKLVSAHPDVAALNAALYKVPIPGMNATYLGAKGQVSRALARLTPTTPPAMPVQSPLPAEPTFLREFPKVGAWRRGLVDAHAAGQAAAFTKHSVTLLQLSALGIPLGAALGAGVGAAAAPSGHRRRGALKGGAVGAGIGALPVSALIGLNL